MFTLAKLAYYSCDDDEREWYDTELEADHIDLQSCCDKLMSSGRDGHHRRYRGDIDTTCSTAATNGHLDCLRFARKTGCPWDKQTCAKTTGGGHLDCLEYAHVKGCEWDERTCVEAAGGGHLMCLKYAHVKGCPWTNADTWTEGSMRDHLDHCGCDGCPQYTNTCIVAAKGGHLHCFEYALRNGCPCDEETQA